MGQPFIGTLARQAGVPIQTIRYYEQMGLLAKARRTASGYRLYRPEALERLQFIKKAKSLGLRLENVREILDLTDRGRCPCGHVQRLLQARLQELREKIADMRTLERRLKGATAPGCPPNFRPRGKALCPTIDRQRVQKRKSR